MKGTVQNFSQCRMPFLIRGFLYPLFALFFICIEFQVAMAGWPSVSWSDWEQYNTDVTFRKERVLNNFLGSEGTDSSGNKNWDEKF